MIILIGEGGTGKTTILNELEKKGYKKPINNTTRPKREDDENTKEYNFVTKEEFEKCGTKINYSKEQNLMGNFMD